MKKVMSMFMTIFIIWAVLMLVDYKRAYLDEGKLLIMLNLNITDEYTERTGLGYSVKLYDYDPDNMKHGQVMKEFKIFNIVVSEEVAHVYTD